MIKAIRTLSVLLLASAFAAGCGDKSAKEELPYLSVYEMQHNIFSSNLSYETVAEPRISQGRVPVEVKILFPGKYFNPSAIMYVTPKLWFLGVVEEGESGKTKNICVDGYTVTFKGTDYPENLLTYRTVDGSKNSTHSVSCGFNYGQYDPASYRLDLLMDITDGTNSYPVTLEMWSGASSAQP